MGIRARLLAALLSLPAISRAATTITDGFWYPDFPITAPAISSLLTIDADGEKVGYVFKASKTGTITGVGFRTGTITNPQPLDVTIQVVQSTSGHPSGTLFGGSSSGTIPSAGLASNTTYQATLSVGASVTKGDLFAPIVQFSSTTGNITLAGPSVNYRASGLFYNVTFAAGAWSKAITPPIMWVEYSDGSYDYNPALQVPWASATAANYASNSTPDEKGLKFQMGADMTLAGVKFLAAANPAPSSVTFYSSDGSSILQSVVIDTDTISGSAGFFEVYFDTPTAITANTSYYVGVEPIVTTMNMAMYVMTMPKDATLGQLPGGSNLIYVDRTNHGSWTEYTHQRPFMSLLFRAIPTGSGGGGGGGSYGFP